MKKSSDDFLQDILYSKFEYDRGLFLFTPPTGFGKSFSAEQDIARYIKNCEENHEEPRIVFYLTSQKKQFPDLHSSFKSVFGNEEAFSKYVLEIRKNEEYILNEKNESRLLEMHNKKEDYPQFEKIFSECPTYQYLIQDIQEIQNFAKIPDKSEGLITYIRKTKERVTSETSSLLRQLEEYFDNLIKKIEQKEHKVIEDKINYKISLIKNKIPWLIKLFPAIETRNYKVFVTTMAKFFMGNSTIIEKHYSFIDNPITEKAIIIIDEFDTTKSDIDEWYNKAAVDSPENLLELFKNINTSFLSKRFPKVVLEYWNKQKFNIESFIKDAERIDERYSAVSKFYKTHPDDIDDQKIVFYSNNDSRTVCNKLRPFGISDEEDEKRNFIKLKNKKETDDINIERMLDEVVRYMNRFETFIRFTAQYLSSQSKTLFENEVYSLLNLFQIGNSEKRVLKDNICRKSLYRPKKDGLTVEKDYTYYFRGFNTIVLNDTERNKYLTEFLYNKKISTAEVFMIKLAQRANVIGMSATAKVQTLENYNMEYISDKLGEDYHDIKQEEDSDIRKHVAEIHDQYRKNKIKIVTEKLINPSLKKYSADNKEGIEKAILRKIFIEDDEANDYHTIIKRNSADDDSHYRYSIYLEVIQAIQKFILTKYSRLWFVMSTPILKNKYNIEIFEHALADICFRNGLAPDDYELLFVDGSRDFEVKREQYKELLKKNKKVMVFLAYKSAQAGVNLQYEDIDKNTVCIFKDNYSKTDKRYLTKDADGLVLLDITQKLFRYQFFDDDDSMSDYEKKIRTEILLTKINELREYGILDEGEKNNVIDAVMTNDSSFKPITSKIVTSVNEHKVICNGVLQAVMQSVGRLMRSFNKNKTITILIDEKVVDSLNQANKDKYYVLPELESIFEISKTSEPSEPQQVLEKEKLAEKVSDRLNTFILMMTHSPWTKENHDQYISLAEQYLRMPCSDSNTNELYMEFLTKGNSYIYCQANNYQNCYINFEGNSEILTHRTKNSGIYFSEPIQASLEKSGLPVLLKNKYIDEYFTLKGYAKSFESKKYMMPPVAYNNIYKGRIGEIALRVVFEKQFNIAVYDIKNLNYFEKFDFDLGNGIYIDSKYWNSTYVREDSLFPWCLEKLEKINGKKVILIKILQDENNTLKNIEYRENCKIIIVPYLLDKSGNPNYEFGKEIKKVILEAKDDN